MAKIETNTGFGNKTDFSAPENGFGGVGSEVNSGSYDGRVPSQPSPMGHTPIPVPGNGGGDGIIR